MRRDQRSVRDENSPPTHSLKQVIGAVLIVYAVILALDARGLYNWTLKLPVSETTRMLREVAKAHWRNTAKHGLEEPKHSIETVFLAWQDAHPLLYPRKYAEIERRRMEKEQRKLQQAAADKADPKAAAKRQAAKAHFDDVNAMPRKARPKVLIVGDSIMMSVGPVIKRDIVSKLGGAAIVQAKLATGLARPDVLNWPAEVRRLTAKQRFDYVVISLGTNDSQDFVENGEILTYGTTPWVSAYNRRLNAIMAATCAGASKGLWIGLPPMQSPAFHRKAVRINSWAKRQAARHDCMQYVSVDQVLGDERGNYTGYRKIGDQLEKVRMVDGIHVTARGGSLISSFLLSLIDQRFAIHSH